MGHNLGKQVGQASNQATEARPGQRRRRSSDGQIPGSVPPGRGKTIHESQRMRATTPILSASPGPATANTYRRFTALAVR